MSAARLAALACLLAACLLGPVLAADADVGRRLYRDGVRASGDPLAGVALGGAVIAGSCASCHRPSGFGTLEGGAAVPAVTGEALFGGGLERRADLFRRLYLEPGPAGLLADARAGEGRPAYTEESLGRALREGVDPAGRALDPLMPRYDLDDAEVAALAAYLAGLGAGPAPGVDGEEIHLATVVAPGVDAARRRDHLGVLQAYVERKNREVANLLARPGASPHHRDDFAVGYRRWRLHVWELAGPPAQWRRQLETLSAARPVFALVGGLGGAEWRPVHDFCEAERVPCLFPQVPLPPAEPGDWALYLDRGVAGEAAALAAALAEAAAGGAIVQVWRDGDGAGEAAAASFRASLPPVLAARLVDRPLPASGEPDAAGWHRLLDDALSPLTLVLWLDRWPSALPADLAPRLAAVHLSARLLGGEPPAPPPPLAERLRLLWPYALPASPAPHARRVHAWLRSRRLPPGDERLQRSTWWTMAVLDHALAHMVDHFDRAWLVERVEHEAELVPDPAVHPPLSLGPGQRFASKGLWIVRLDPSAVGGVAPVGTWRRVPANRRMDDSSPAVQAAPSIGTSPSDPARRAAIASSAVRSDPSMKPV